MSRAHFLARFSFRSRHRGSVAVMAMLAAIPLVLAIGGAIDFGRAAIVKARLQTALDAAGLAVGSTDPYRPDLMDVLSRYFYANYTPDKLGNVTGLNMRIDENVIALSASADVQTVFLDIVGTHSMSVGVSAEIVRETTGLEVVMVLDNTGSMGSGGKLDALKGAASSLVNILFGDSTAPDLLKVGLVPFAGAVNVGTDFDVDQLNPFDAFVKAGQRTDWGRGAWGGCVEARAYPNDTLDTGVALGGKWDTFLWPDSCYSSGEAGCLDTTHININNWWYRSDGSYHDDLSFPWTSGPNRECPRPLTPLTNQKVTLLNEIDAMTATGYTHIGLGAVWGWRVVSPDAPFTEGVPYDNEAWRKAVIILTDGDNTTNNSVYTGYGYPSEGRLAGTTGGWASKQQLDQRLSETCENMKAVGIQVYTITFNLGSETTKTLFRQCASSPEQYFDSPDNLSLQGAFRAIANQLSNLRVFR
ncbi:MAG: hypothetical protein H6981_08660 [Gammaproteobacteria bacterium]|nr:hypothetical protein [Gammaproteobacteria bacterium]MCP5136859.1 hypothetical protein [Gammaproteobacteria bacterium]